jgi:hypothetical protein
MFCANCGTRISERAVYCPNCGVSTGVGHVPYSSGGLADNAPRANASFDAGGAGMPPQPIPNYLVQAILVTIFCCLPLGIPAIVFAAQVNGKIQAGDMPGAMELSRKARLFAWWSFGVGLVGMALYVMIAVLAAMADA